MSSKIELFDKYLNNSLSDDERDQLAELLEDEAIGRELVEYTIETRDIIVAAGTIKPSRKYKLLYPIMAFAALVIVGFVVWLFQPNELKVLSGIAYKVDGNQQMIYQKHYIPAGTKLLVEERYLCEYADGTTVDFAPGTIVEIISHEPKALFIHKGKVNSTISKQETGPMQFQTSDGVVNVLGTELVLFKDEGSPSSLRVIEGTVEVKNNRGDEIKIGRGEAAVMRSDSPIIKGDNAQGGFVSTRELGEGSEFAQQRQREISRYYPLEFKLNSTGMVFRLIPAMDADSTPYYMGKYEVTQKQWTDVMGFNPSTHHKQGDNYPVETVNGESCMTFILRLSEKEKLGNWELSLPTEKEWQHACRAGTNTRFYTGDSESDLSRAAWWGWHNGNARRQPHEVGQLLPNAYGLHDMHGNLWEWCDMEPNGAAPKMGGSWNAEAKFHSVDYTHLGSFMNKSDKIGFRLVVRLKD